MKVSKMKYYLGSYTNKVRNFSSIGLRIEAMCGEGSSLPVYFYLMGLVAGDAADRNFSFRNYAVFCAKYYPKLFQHEWDYYKDTRVVNASMLYIIGTLFTAKCYDSLVYAYENMPSKVSRTDQLDIYYIYAKAILEPIQVNELPTLTILDESSPVTIMYCKLVESMLKEYHIKAYAEMKR